MNHENTTVTSSGKTNNIPKDYIYCPAADGACPRTPQCLRAIAYRQLTATEAPAKPGPIRIVHPACVASAADGCEYYRDSTPVRFAQGMTKLFDEADFRSIFKYREIYRHLNQTADIGDEAMDCLLKILVKMS